MERSAGILLPVFSLPGPYGIGSLGREARAFAEFLHNAGQRWWQVPPVGPTGAGNSPYTSESTFAGNPPLIDLEDLRDRGLLTEAELSAARVPGGRRPSTTPPCMRAGEALLRRAFSRLGGAEAQSVRDFAAANPWLGEYALYRALKACFRPDGLVRLAGQGPPEPRPGGAGGRPAGAGGGYRFSPGGAVLVLLPVEGPEGPRQRPGGADHRGSAHLCVPGQRRRVERAEGVPAGQGRGGPAGWRACRRTTSRRRASCGATPCTTGRPRSGTASAGGSEGWRAPPACSTPSASTTSGPLSGTGPSPPGRRPPERAAGNPVPEWTCCGS